MELKMHHLSETYTAVDWTYRELIEDAIQQGLSGKVFYFCSEEGICEGQGKLLSLEDKAEGLFILLEDKSQIRVDRIITLYGKPGAAYSDYELYGNACLDCNGGID